jgi:phosphoribosylamine--glycine ligase
MNVLVIGGGGREHAISWKLAAEDKVSEVFVAPGNAGTAADPRLTNVSIEMDALTEFVAREKIGLVVFGPEAPLVAGHADRLRKNGTLVVGPNADGALLEGSKAFCKEILVAAGVPTAAYAEVSTEEEIHAFVDSFQGEALVVKADGLAGGKGVIVCDGVEDARAAAIAMLRDRPFGDASASIVLEERLRGIETSYIVLTDGERFVALPTSQDHKRLLDGDNGPNTGGMGAYSPAPFVTAAVAREIEEKAIRPTLLELKRRGIDYRGFLFAGVMLTESGPQILEYNVRLGDPETQALMAALGDGFLEALLGAASGDLRVTAFEGCRAAATIVLAAEGYPRAPQNGATIEGLEADFDAGVVVFHAGTRNAGDRVVVNGGRVLGVTARSEDPKRAVALAYEAAAQISWSGMQRRSDIGKALLG